MKDQFKEALDAGYSESEILSHIKKSKPDMYEKFEKAKKAGYSNEEIFGYLGKKSEPSSTKEVAKEVAVSPVAGALGSYGGLQSLLFRLLGAERSPMTPGQAALTQAEFKAPESQLPWLQESEDILPRYGALPTSTEIREKVGIQEPSTVPGKYAKRIGESVGGGAALGMVSPADVVRGALAGGAGQTVEEMGGGPVAQMLAEIGAFSGPDLAKGLTKLRGKPVIEESGLTLPKVTERGGEEFRYFKPQASASAIEKAEKNVADQAGKYLSEIRSKEIPISKLVEKGIDIEERNAQNFKKISSIAEELPNKIESNNIHDYLTQQKEKLLKVPVPSKEKENILKEIDKYGSKFKAETEGTHFYSPSEYLKQFRAINEDLKSIYETSLLKGKRSETVRFLEGLKDSIVSTLEKGTPKEFSELFRKANQEYSQTKKLEYFDRVMEKIHEGDKLDPRKFFKYVSNPKNAAIMKKTIGNESFDRMKLMARDLDKTRHNLNLIEKMDLKSLFKRHAVSKGVSAVLAFLGFKLPVGIHIGKELIEWARSKALLDPKVNRDIHAFLKAARSNNEKAIINSISQLDKSLKEK